MGKVEKVIKSRDGKICEAEIAYKRQDFGDNTWRHSTVERPVRLIVKLWNLEDTSILENLKSVQAMANEILNVSDASSSAHINVFNSSKGNYDITNDSNMFSQKKCVELLVILSVMKVLTVLSIVRRTLLLVRIKSDSAL